MKDLKNKVLIGALSLAVAASFAGAISSTLAWYEYVTRASVSYSGTSISNSEMLQIGIQTDIDLSSVGLSSETLSDGKTYAFNSAGQGLTSAQIQEYLKHTDYATASLYPVTSLRYQEGDDLSLKTSPIAGEPRIHEEASRKSYLTLPLAFRVQKVTSTSGQYVGGESIYLTDSTVACSGGNVNQAVRIFFDGQNKFVLNPTASSDGSTTVAGVLDLNGDGYYDTTTSSFSAPYGSELLYGDYEGSKELSYSAIDSEMEDINETGASEKNTFYAKHQGGYNFYPDYSSITLEKAEYSSIHSVKPNDDGKGNLTGGKVLAVTDSDSKVANLSVTIYLEGWDHSVVDAELEHSFSLGMQFQINKVQ